MREYNDFNQNFKFLIRSKCDEGTAKEFNLEVKRATKQFLKWYTNGESIDTAMSKLTRSYGGIISQIVVININNLIAKQA